MNKTKAEINQLLENNYLIIKKIADILWYKKFKIIFEKINTSYDDYIGMSFVIIVENIHCWDESKGSNFNSFCNFVLRKKLCTYITAQNRKKRMGQTYAESIYQKIKNDSDTEIIDLIEDTDIWDDSEFLIENILEKIKYKQERKILKLLMDGFSVMDIAEKMNTSERKIRNIIYDIRKRPEIIRIINRELKK